jgi:hypothetical protein
MVQEKGQLLLYGADSICATRQAKLNWALVGQSLLPTRKGLEMQYVKRWAAYLLLAAIVLPLLAADDKKPDDKKPATDSKSDDKKTDEKKTDVKKTDVKKVLEKNVNTEKSIRAGELRGKIVAVIESKKSLRLSIPLQVPRINAGELRAAANDEVNYKLQLARGNASAAAQHLYNMQIHQARSVTVHTEYKEIELQTIEDVKIRLANPAPDYDDKGKPVRPSAKKLKELKGPDPKLPGYTGEFSNLAGEQVVTVTLVKKKSEGGPKLPPVKGKAADPSALLVDLPQVAMILVEYDPNANPAK